MLFKAHERSTANYIKENIFKQNDWFENVLGFRLIRRKRGGGPLEEGGVEGREEEEREDAAVSKEEEDKKERAKIDDLWASFKQETASVHKGKVHVFVILHVARSVLHTRLTYFILFPDSLPSTIIHICVEFYYGVKQRTS